MSLVAEERVPVAASRDRIWPIFTDADALRRVLPGCETLEAAEDGSFRGVLASKLQFLTIRADVVGRLLDLEPPERLRLELDGRPRGLAGGFRASIPIELFDDGPGTLVHYRLELTTSGRLASFGAPLMRDAFRRQVGTLIRNLEAELRGPSSAGDQLDADRGTAPGAR